MASDKDITELLVVARNGDESALNRLFPIIYQKLRSIAHRELNRLRPGDTIDTIALVHEAFIKLMDQSKAEYQDRIHFFSVAATAMRQILLNYARKKMTQRRGGDMKKVKLDTDLTPSEEQAEILISLDESLTRLKSEDERQHQIVELRFFGGMTEVEIGDLLGITERTVRRDWVKAKAYLANELDPDVL